MFVLSAANDYCPISTDLSILLQYYALPRAPRTARKLNDPIIQPFSSASFSAACCLP